MIDQTIYFNKSDVNLLGFLFWSKPQIDRSTITKQNDNRSIIYGLVISNNARCHICGHIVFITLQLSTVHQVLNRVVIF